MVWKAEPIQHILEIRHIGEEGIEYLESQEFTPDGYSTNISLNLSTCDTELRVIPYTLEHLKRPIKEDYENGVVTQLFLGIRDKTGIAYVGKLWTPKDFSINKVTQYFFQNDEPYGFRFNLISGDEWPLDQPPVLDERLMKYVTDLKEIRPDATGSLDRCIAHLTRLSPEYAESSADGSAFFGLARKYFCPL